MNWEDILNQTDGKLSVEMFYGKLNKSINQVVSTSISFQIRRLFHSIDDNA